MKNGKYGVGIIGFGGIARSCHVPGWRKLKDVEIIGVSDVSEEARKSAVAAGIENVFEHHDRLLEREDIDIVDVCAPNTIHFPAVVAALNAGKDVLCEKPLAVSVEEVTGMMEAAKKAGKKLMAAQHQRFRRESEIMKKLIDAGEFGEIYCALAYALRQRLLPARPGFIRKDLAGGGPMFDIGVHILDLTYWFMGCPGVDSVKGEVYTKLAKREDIHGDWGEWDRDAYDVEDFATGFVRFDSGASVSLSTSFLAHMEKKEDFSTQLFGTHAGVHWPGGKIIRERNRRVEEVEISMGPETEEPHHKEIRVFFECVRDGRDVPVKPGESLEVIKMLEGIYRSAETGREVVFS